MIVTENLKNLSWHSKDKNMNKKTLYSLVLVTMLVLVFFPFLTRGADSIGGIVGTIKTNLQGIGAGVATIAFVVAGIMFLTATANPSRITIAKGALVAGVIGIVIILLADGACQFVKTFTGASGSCTADSSSSSSTAVDRDKIGSAASYQAMTGTGPTSDPATILNQASQWDGMSDPQRSSAASSSGFQSSVSQNYDYMMSNVSNIK